jgi:predicted KAP-like P-loop ATPase
VHNPFKTLALLRTHQPPQVDHSSGPSAAGGEPDRSRSLALVADRPIEAKDEDRLERGGLVKAIVATVERAPSTGFVMGLAGGWGEGKSSVLNMVAEELEALELARVVRFNPWLFAGSDELLLRFFSEFAAALRLGGRAGKRAASALSKLGAALNRLGPVPLVGGPLEAGGTVAQGAARLLEAGTSLHDRQRDVKRALLDLNQPVVVIIDDIDRLRSHDEIAEMVRLIRLVGDLPGVTYLVAYEREEVARALGDGELSRGEAYLEKIVQTVFELPAVRRDLLDKLLTEAMSESIGALNQRRFERQRFEALQLAGLRRLFRNVRDVRRFASALPATVAILDDEVELSDVLALEALRLLEPQVFGLIASHPEALTTLSSEAVLGSRHTLDEHKRVVAQIIEIARQPSIIEDLLKQLFPAAGRHLGGGTYSASFAREWRAEGRVANFEILTIYLERGLPQGMVSARQVTTAVAMLDNREALERLLADTGEDQLIQLLGRLEDYAGRLELDEPVMTIQVLVEAAARLRPREQQGFRYDGHVAVSRLLLRIMRGLDADQVEAIMHAVRWPDLSTRAEIVGMVGYREVGNQLVTDAVATELEQEMVEAVLDAPIAELAKELDLARLLWIAREGEPHRTSERLVTLIEDPLLLMRWLGQRLIEKRGETGTSFVLPWTTLTEEVDPERLVAAVRALGDRWPPEDAAQREQEAIGQARHYADHPETAADDLRRFTGD